jgi:hypothetical protein
MLSRLADVANWKRRTTTVFISYRRDITAGEAKALHDSLLAQLNRNSTIFMDVDSISLGRDFRKELQDRLNSCDLMLVLIGREWADLKDERGRTRLEDPTDYVRSEIEMALKRDIMVTPVLVQGARMPAPAQLPSEIQELVYRTGFVLSHERWDSDVREMIRRLGLNVTDWTRILWRICLAILAIFITGNVIFLIYLIKVNNLNNLTQNFILPPGQVVDSKEPNDNIYQANKTDFGGTITGRVTEYDRVDWYAFNTPEQVGDKILVVFRWIEGASLVDITIYDKNERKIAWMNGTGGTQSTMVSIQTNQTYYVKISLNWGGGAKYELSVRNPA